MAYVGKVGICPICRVEAPFTKKWVLNKYGERYEYIVFHHGEKNHYINAHGARIKGFKKGEVEKIITEKICSSSFKWGAFRIRDIMEFLASDYPELNVNTVRNALLKLVNSGVLSSESVEGRRYFMSLAQNERLDFSMESISLELVDVGGDGNYAFHSHSGTVVNDKEWPLFFVMYRILGDESIALDEMNLSCRRCDTNERIPVIVDGDYPTEKRILLRMSEPVPPRGKREICISYEWPERKHSFIYSAATYLNTFRLKFYGNKKIRYNVTMSEPNSGSVRKITNLVEEGMDKGWQHIYSLRLRALRPFTYIQFDWDLCEQ